MDLGWDQLAAPLSLEPRRHHGRRGLRLRQPVAAPLRIAPFSHSFAGCSDAPLDPGREVATLKALSDHTRWDGPGLRFLQAAEEVNIRLASGCRCPTRCRCTRRISSENNPPVVFPTRPAAACAVPAATGHSIWPTLHSLRAPRRAFPPEVTGAPSILDWSQVCRLCCWILSSSIEN